MLRILAMAATRRAITEEQQGHSHNFSFSLLPKRKQEYPSRHNITVYVLHLQQDKLYVGRTSSIKNRMHEIFSAKTNVPIFVQKHPPLSVAAFFPNSDPYDEDKIVKVMMATFGIDNVRGGSYSSLILTDDDRRCINKEIYNACSVCFICGSGDHWAARCPSKQ